MLLLSELKDTPFSRSSIRCRWSWVCYRAYFLLGCFLILNILVMSRLLKAESVVEDKRKSEQALFASRLSSRKTAGQQVKATLSASKLASAKKSSSGQNSSINVPKVHARTVRRFQHSDKVLFGKKNPTNFHLVWRV